MSQQLAVYEHAREALAAAVRFDEVTQLRTAAQQAEAYARIANDRRLQADAAEIVARAERKLGIMLRKAKGEGLLSQGGRPANSNLSEPKTGTDGEPVFDNTPFTLADIGVDKKLSSRAQKAADLADDEFEAGVQDKRDKILSTDAPVVSAPKLKTVKVDKPASVASLEPRKWHQFSFSVIALSMASDRVSSEALQKLAEHCGIIAIDGEVLDFTPEAIEAMGSLATAALKAIGDDSSDEPREPHVYSHDTRYQQAVTIAREVEAVGASLLQRRMGIGYNLACSLIEWMQRDGIIGPNNGAGQYAVLPDTASETQHPVSHAISERLETASRSDGDDSTVSGARTEATAVTAGETATNFLEAARLREVYEGEVVLLAPKLGKLTQAEAEAALRAGRAASVSPLLIAQDLQHPVGTVKTWLNRLGLTSLDHMNQMNAERQQAAQARKTGDA